MKKLVFSVFCLAAVVASLVSVAGCNLNFNESPLGPTYAPPPSPTPIVTPTPIARPTGIAETSDVNSMAIFLYGYSACTVTPPSNNALFQVPLGCSAELTATPKRSDGTDAVNHGSLITWSGSTDVATLTPQSANPLFNRTLKPLKTGTITVTATLVDPAGRQHLATRVITVTP